MLEGHWTEELFLTHGEVFLAIHEHGWEHGEEQARGLKAMFNHFGVPSEGRVLDVPCGIGRHATRLATMGYRTLGIDLSPAYVERACELAAKADVATRARYRVGDLRKLRDAIAEDERPFDAAVDLWTSLGYYGETADLELLRGLWDLVRPTGILVVSVVNRDAVVRHHDPQKYEEFGEIVNIEESRLDLDASRMQNTWRFFRKRGEDLEGIVTVPVEHRIYSLHELRFLFERAGWRLEGSFGSYGMDPVTTDSPQLIIVGRR